MIALADGLLIDLPRARDHAHVHEGEGLLQSQRRSDMYIEDLVIGAGEEFNDIALSEPPVTHQSADIGSGG